jgi:hypothetical protein
MVDLKETEANQVPAEVPVKEQPDVREKVAKPRKRTGKQGGAVREPPGRPQTKAGNNDGHMRQGGNQDDMVNSSLLSHDCALSPPPFSVTI